MTLQLRLETRESVEPIVLQDCMQQQQPQHEVKDYKDLAVCNSDVLTEKGNLKPKKYNALNIG